MLYSYAIARYMLSPVRLSVRPSVTLLSGGDLVSCVQYTKAVARFPLR